MSDPILFWTVFAVIAANIIILVSALISADREARTLPSDGGKAADDPAYGLV
jgi:hypothetical protein